MTSCIDFGNAGKIDRRVLYIFFHTNETLLLVNEKLFLLIFLHIIFNGLS